MVATISGEGRLAQRLERCVDIAEVTGSSPVPPTRGVIIFPTLTRIDNTNCQTYNGAGMRKGILVVAVLLISLIVSGCGKPDVTGTYAYVPFNGSLCYLTIYQNGTFLYHDVGYTDDYTGRWKIEERERYEGKSNWLMMYWDKYGLVSGLEIIGDSRLVNGDEIWVKQEEAL